MSIHLYIVTTKAVNHLKSGKYNDDGILINV